MSLRASVGVRARISGSVGVRVRVRVVAHRAESVGELGRASPPPVDIDRVLAEGAARLA